ncbi:MAG: Cyclic di-GMP phosphodiesterase response regulator RpfG [Firmicutes bacterium ADurb.Bin419]|nr:MAG: Cyclic di-GMP phosphodiesterase response regulator RpfG [Firmicutes bacterium ADurb.Bin419]
MMDIEENIIPKFAHLLGQNKEFIFQDWINLVKNNLIIENSLELEFLITGFKRIIDDFTTSLEGGDLKAYYRNNLIIARDIVCNDIEYTKFIRLFHLLEESYKKVLSQTLDPSQLLHNFNVLDKINRKTISIVLNTYFEIKDSTAFALVKLTELRDPQTGYHVERTREYTFLLANRLGCSDEFINQLYKAAPLHDIGKVGIKDSILLKPGKLSKKEYESMKEHTRIGAMAINDIISSHIISRGYLLMARDIALYHHEKYDGSGYPEGLSRESIPFCARIFAVADAYDTIVSKRPYKKAYSHEEAVRRIHRDSGTHFDPEVVEAFMSVKTEFKMVNNSLNRL